MKDVLGWRAGRRIDRGPRAILKLGDSSVCRSENPDLRHPQFLPVGRGRLANPGKASELALPLVYLFPEKICRRASVNPIECNRKAEIMPQTQNLAANADSVSEKRRLLDSAKFPLSHAAISAPQLLDCEALLASL